MLNRRKNAGRRPALHKVPVKPQLLTVTDYITRAGQRLRNGMPLPGDIAGNADIPLLRLGAAFLVLLRQLLEDHTQIGLVDLPARL